MSHDKTREILEEAEFSAAERRVLEARARAAAAPGLESRGASSTDEVIVVRCGAGLYGLPGREVIAVAALTRLSPLPLMPPNVAGLTTFRGGIVIVFHLHALLGMPPSLSEYGRMILIEADCGLAVDSVERSETLRELCPPPHDLVTSATLVQGVTYSGVTVIDVEELRRSEALVVDIPAINIGEFGPTS